MRTMRKDVLVPNGNLAPTPGLYVTVHGGGVMGALIRKFTRAPVAHAYVYVGPHPQGDLIEATPKGVRWGRTSQYDPKTSYPAKDTITDAQSQAMVAAAIGLVGTGYGWVADVFLGMRSVHMWVPRLLFKLKVVAKNDECAQLADLVGIKAGVHYFDDGRLPGEVSPADLWRRDYRKPR